MKITICSCASRTFIEKEKVARLVVAAKKAGIEVEIARDLCEMCQEKNPAIKELAKTTIVACYPNAVKALMDFAGEDNVKSMNLRSESVAQIMKALTGEDVSFASELNEEENEVLATIKSFPVKRGCDAWYPTIDKSRCINCKKCYQFCPFGVYEEIEGKVTVVNPTKCKNNCPSCSRMCPAGAIYFPKYDKSPINGGEAIEEATALTDKSFGEELRKKLELRKAGIKLTKD